MLVTNSMVVLMFLILGIVFAKGKGAYLIAGYNTLPKQEKDKLDQKALCACMAVMMFGLAAAWMVFGIGVQVGLPWLSGIGMALFLGEIVFFLIYMNTGKRVQRKDEPIDPAASDSSEKTE